MPRLDIKLIRRNAFRKFGTRCEAGPRNKIIISQIQTINKLTSWDGLGFRPRPKW